MNQRQKLGLLIILVSLLLIFGIIYFIFMREPAVPTVNPDEPIVPVVQLPKEPDTSTTTPSDRPRNHQLYDITQEEEHQINSSDIAKIANAFAERLGSFSNQSNYSNFEDLNIFMTASMRTWALGYVDKMRADNPYDGNYYGITTKAIANEITQFNDQEATAEIIVSTQRREIRMDGGENNFDQDLRLTFVKENNQWLVDGAYWLK
jgi:hypothetical protein